MKTKLRKSTKFFFLVEIISLFCELKMLQRVLILTYYKNYTLIQLLIKSIYMNEKASFLFGFFETVSDQFIKFWTHLRNLLILRIEKCNIFLTIF